MRVLRGPVMEWCCKRLTYLIRSEPDQLYARIAVLRRITEPTVNARIANSSFNPLTPTLFIVRYHSSGKSILMKIFGRRNVDQRLIYNLFNYFVHSWSNPDLYLTLMELVANLANTKWCKKPGKWLKPWEYSVRAIQWTATWQGLDGLWKSVRPLDERSLIFPNLVMLVFTR